MMDPQPDIERAISMEHAVEKRRAVHVDLIDSSSQIMYQLTLKEKRREGPNKYMHKKKIFIGKRNLICTNCRKPRHSHDTYFQLHGVPDFYRSLNEKKKKGTNNKHFVVNVDDKNEGVVATSSPNVAGIMSELLKLIQNNNTPSDLITNFASYAHRDEEFAGNVLKLV
ncbi:UNVERIFIED_CONTAM: hypothetical protein Sangu_2906200 [Sesamum angustifolium]|uniref:Uncharacterized protein n=1 Tax=Sesamum angustifolium TaxID=2727405 RepID=A0AAW2IMV9_9LAMI